MQRFYLPDYRPEFNEFISTDADFLHQVTKVLRMGVGDRCRVFGHDGGTEVEMEIIVL